MRKLEEIRNDIDQMEERLLVAKADYADVVMDYMELGYDVSKHHVPEGFRKEVVKIKEELDLLYEFYEAFHA